MWADILAHWQKTTGFMLFSYPSISGEGYDVLSMTNNNRHMMCILKSHLVSPHETADTLDSRTRERHFFQPAQLQALFPPQSEAGLKRSNGFPQLVALHREKVSAH